MNILLLITKGEIGGAQTSVLNLAIKLKENGENVTVGFGQGNFLEEKLKEKGIPFIKLHSLSRTYSLFKGLVFTKEIYNFLNKHKFDAIHLNSTNTLFAAIGSKLSRNKPKIIFTFRGLSLIDPLYTKSNIKRFFYKIIFKIFLKFVDEQVYVSCENRDMAKKIGLAKNDHIIYNGLPDLTNNFLSKEEARQQLSLKLNTDIQNAFLIGSVGRLAYQKNYDFLIKQIKKISDKNNQIKCIIIGSGPEENKLNKIIKKEKMEKQIYLTGDITDAWRYLKAFDIFVLTSRYEGLSITLLEALSAGLPILASDVQGNHELINNVGYLYNFDNEIDFQEKIMRLISDENERKNLSNKSIKKSKEFDINTTAKQYLVIYKK